MRRLCSGYSVGHLRFQRLLAGDQETLEKRDEPVLVPGAHGASSSDSAPSSRLLLADFYGALQDDEREQAARQGQQPVTPADAGPGHDQQQGEGAGDEPLPAEVHELVVAQAGQGGPDPDIDVEQYEHLYDEPHRADRVAGDAGAVGAAEEKGGEDGGVGDEGHVLGQVEQREADGGVLEVETARQFLLGLDEVEGGPCHFGRYGDEEDGGRGPEGRAGCSSGTGTRRAGRRRWRSCAANRSATRRWRRSGRGRPRTRSSGRWPAPRPSGGTWNLRTTPPASRRRR